jgi:toxin ParE1/3/4
MKLVYTVEVQRDLDEILTFLARNFPTVSAPFQRRLRAIERRIGSWPHSAQEVEQRAGVRMVPFIQYPYKLFYRVANDRIEILHVHHAARP